MATQILRLPLTAKADTSGNVLIEQSPPPNTTWVFSQVIVQAAPASATTICGCAIYINGLLYCASSNADQDVASTDPPITASPGDQVAIIFVGCTPGSQATVTLYGTSVTPD